MKVIYLGNFGHRFSDQTEDHIRYGFKKEGHEVISVHERDFDVNKLIKQKGDLFLMHKGGMHYGVGIKDLLELLTKMSIPKAYWFFDPVLLHDTGDRETWVRTITPYVDYAFLTDDAWIRATNHKNTYCLRQGVGNENTSLGKYRKEYDCDIAFLGSVYGQRIAWIQELQKIFGRRLKVFNNIFGRELYDFCASCKLILAPNYPSNDFYWSNRIYVTIGSGGCMVHPRLEGLKEEFTVGKHFIGYKGFEDMVEKINYYLEHEDERKKIQMAGYKHCIKNFTYQHRVAEMVKMIQHGYKT